MMPLYSRLPRRVGLFIEAAVPALLIFAILGIGYVKTNANAKLSHQAKEQSAQIAVAQRQDAINACATVLASDVNLHDFLAKSIGSGPRATDPVAQKFLSDLAKSQITTYDTCLAKADPANHHPPPAHR